MSALVLGSKLFKTRWVVVPISASRACSPVSGTGNGAQNVSIKLYGMGWLRNSCSSKIS